MSDKRLKILAERTGLRVVAKGPWGGPAVAGELQGFPVAAAWTRTERQASVSFLVRFARGSWSGGPEGGKDLILGSEALRVASGKKAVPKSLGATLVVGEDRITLAWNFSFFAPKPDVVAALLKSLAELVARMAKPIGRACEGCGRETSEGLWLADGTPSRICAPCRAGQDEAGRQALEAYDRLGPNPVLGLLFGLATAVGLALAWGGLAYAIERIFLWGAIGIGLALAWMVNRGMGKVNLFGQVLTVALTLATVVAGDFIFMLLTARTHLSGGDTVGALDFLKDNFLRLEFQEGNGVASLIFALVGAGYVLYHNRRPRFHVRYEPLG